MKPIHIQQLPQQNKSLPLKLYLLKNLGTSTHPNCRSLLREELFNSLKQVGHCPKADLLDLEKLPEHETLNISLSHGSHHSLMGWIPKPHRLGVDMESLERLSDRVIKRVSTDKELSLAPNTHYLWSTKEAVLKALWPFFNVVSSVEIIDWHALTPQCWTFGVELKNHSEGYGELCLIEGHSVAFFTVPI